MADMHDTLTDEEVDALLMSALTVAGEAGVLESDLELIIDWAHETRVRQALLECVLNGSIAIRVVSGEVQFALPEAVPA